MEDILKIIINKPIYEAINTTGYTYKNILLIIKKYCIQNNLDYNILLNSKIEEFSEFLYNESKKEELEFLSEKYKISFKNIKNILMNYCKKNSIKDIFFYKNTFINLDKIYSLIMEGKTFEEIAKIYNCSVSPIKTLIKQYCEDNNLDYDSILIKLKPEKKEFNKEELYNLKVQGKTFEEIAEIYNCSVSPIKTLIKQYCEDNNLDYNSILIKQKPEKKEFNKEELYNLKVQGKTFEEIAKIYNCSVSPIRTLIKQYCEDNNLDYDSILIKQEKREFNEEELYNLKKQGKSFEEIAEIYNCSVSPIKTLIKQYCEDNNLDYDSILIKSEKSDLNKEELYNLKLQGKTFKDIAEIYNCSKNTIKKNIKQYCEDNNLDYDSILIKSEKSYLNKEKLYNLKKQGKSFEEIAEIYNCSVPTIQKNIKQYCEDNNLNYNSILIKSEKSYLNKEELYNLKKQGKSFKDIALMYDCSKDTIRTFIKQYCEDNNLDYEKLLLKINKLNISRENLHNLMSQEKIPSNKLNEMDNNISKEKKLVKKIESRNLK